MGDICVLSTTKRPWLPGAVIMSRINRPILQTAQSDEVRVDRGWHWSGCWLPRPTTILTAIVVGLALFTAVSIDQIVPRGFTRASGPPAPIDDGAVATAYVIAVALLASACLTTQLLACLFVESPRLTIRSVCLWIAVVALFLALWRSGSALVLLILLAAFDYSVASPMILVLLLVGRRPSRTRGAPEPDLMAVSPAHGTSP
jgi:hypothetical protein